MAISYFDRASNVADGGSQTNAAARSVTPPASMQAGDLVFVYCVDGSGVGTLSVSNSGGQTWTSETQNGTVIVRRIFWCVFNGTWSSDPAFVNSTLGTASLTCDMAVFRPTNASASWSVDQANSSVNQGTPSGPPYDVTVAGQTPTTGASVVTIAAVACGDDNTWALQTGGWSNPGGNTQIRNSTGMSSSLAYLIQASAAATGSVVNRQTANGPDATASNIMTFKETLASNSVALERGRRGTNRGINTGLA